MLNLKTDIPIKQDLIDHICMLHAQMRDLIIEEEQLIALAYDSRTLLSKEEVAAKLRCPADRIPRQIPRIRIGKNWLFESGDVDKFIDSKKRLPK